MRNLASLSRHTVVAVALIVTLLAGLIPLGVASAQQTGTARVTCVAQDVHPAPDIYSGKITTLFQNQTVAIDGTTTGQGTEWTRVFVAGTSGWMKSVCLEVISGSTGGGQQLPSGAYAVVNTGALHVRSGPGTQFPSIFSVYRGTVLGLIARDANARWIKVSLDNGVVGWVNSGYIRTSYPLSSLPLDGSEVPPPSQPPAGAYATVTTGALNVRSGPGWWYNVVTSVYRGTTVSLHARNADGSWVKIS